MSLFILAMPLNVTSRTQSLKVFFFVRTIDRMMNMF